LGQIVGYIAWLLLAYVLKLTELLAKISWASVEVVGLSAIVMIISYLVISWLIYKNQKHKFLT